jgi:hypothetical protein
MLKMGFGIMSTQNRRMLLLFLCLTPALLYHCHKEKVPEVVEWIGIQMKGNQEAEKSFRTVGTGEAKVTWWAGGYTYRGGFFQVELIEKKTEKMIFSRTYSYGDTTTGKSEEPRFYWWHSEQKGAFSLKAGMTYTMRIKGTNQAEPGSGWGMWLYRFGEKPKRRESPKRE